MAVAPKNATTLALMVGRSRMSTLTNGGRVSSVPVLAGLLPSIVLNAVLPIIAYSVLTSAGWSATSALLATSVFPIAGTLVGLARSRSLDGLALMSLGFIAIGIAGTLVTGSGRFMLAKEAVLTGVGGIVFALSTLWRRPLAFYFGRQFATGGDPQRIRRWNSYWRYPAFRRVQYTITWVWAIAFLADAGVRLALVSLLPVSTMVWLSQVLLYAVIIAVMTWMFGYIGRTTARAATFAGDIGSMSA